MCVLCGYTGRLVTQAVWLHKLFGYTSRLVTQAVWLHKLFGYTGRLVLDWLSGYTRRLVTQRPSGYTEAVPEIPTQSQLRFRIVKLEALPGCLAEPREAESASCLA